MKVQTTVHDVPVLPLRDTVVYPHGVHSLFVGTERSIRALDAAMTNDRQILVVAKRDAGKQHPSREDLYDVGTMSTLLQLLKLPDGTVKVLIEGGYRARLVDYDDLGEFNHADVEKMHEDSISAEEAEVVIRSVTTQFEQYVQASKKVPQEALSSVSMTEGSASIRQHVSRANLDPSRKSRLPRMTYNSTPA